MNTSNYFSALEHFILKLQQLPDADHAQISEATVDFCHILRLGKVEVVLYENEASEQMGMSVTNCFYDCERSCKSVSISRRMAALDGKIAVYNIYAIEGESGWTEEELNKINIFIAVLSMFREKFRLAKLAHYMTFYDSNLDMHNLKYFMRHGQMMCRSRQIIGYAAVRFNLKRFSTVNQYIGRDGGTLVMKKFLCMVDDLLDDENEVVCRIGGDNFIALVKAEKLPSVLEVLSGTGIVYNDTQNDRILVAATVGVFVIKETDNVKLPTDIMDRVSIAAQIAKLSSDTDIVFFDENLFAKVKHNNEISAKFPKALEDREFLVYYQPKIAIDGRHLSGAEALCRWKHDGQMISPGEFIPVLEQGHDICKLDFYILDTVCKDIRRWLDNGMNVVKVSVNLSRRHLSDTDLLDRIIEIIDSNNVPHEYIEIELTETTTDVEFTDLKHIIGGLQQVGISTSVDDFGIGYSSLNLIKEIPWNVLKLDKSLLPAEGDENPEQKSTMFKYIIAMAQEMGLECISEGVETKEQVQLLAENNCNIAQGFYFDRPLPVEEFETRLSENYVYDK